MLARTVIFFFAIVILLQAETNTTVDEQFPTEYTSDSNQTQDLIDLKSSEESNSSAVTNVSEETNSTLKSLEDYNSSTAAGTLQSEPDIVDANVTKIDDNSSDLVAPTTKLDDVSNLDIVKEQRRQRKVQREEAKDEPDDQARQLVDTIVVKGSVLQGKINQLTSEYISFELIYGEGNIRIKYSDVESLITEHEYHIYFDGKETQGYITEIRDHAFLMIQHGEIEELITISKIDRFVISENEDASFENRMRNTFPYWSGNVDVGIEYESGNNIKNKLKIGGHVERKYMVHKTIFDILYSYEVTETIDSPEVLNKKEFYTFLEHNYAFTKNDFMFAEIGYDFDVPRGVDGRIYPSFGYGYRIATGKKRWIQFKVGAGYVWETFIDDPVFNIAPEELENRYAAGFFGVDAEYEVRDLQLLNRILFGATFFYMPGIEDLTHNWLLRYSGTASIPLSKALVLKIIARQVADNNPSPDVGNNKYTFDLYLSLRF